MTREQRAAFVAVLLPLAQAMRVDVDAATWAVYARALQDVPHRLLSETVDRLIREPRQFFPKAGELRAECERQRQAWLLARPWSPCELCAESPGYLETTDGSGVVRLARCACWRAHQAAISEAGMGTALALPSPREVVEA